MAKKPTEAERLFQPHIPPKVTRQVAVAVKAFAAGTADKQQQEFLFKWIVHDLARTYDLSYRPGELEQQRATDFAEGKRSIGLHLVHLVNYPVSLLDKDS